MIRQFGIFAKYWQPGQVKTRLAADIGPAPAARLHRVFLKTLLRRFERLGDRRVLAYAAAGRGPQFAELAGPQWLIAPQCEGDLGRRIEGYFASAFDAGADRVVLIGSDSPTLPETLIAEAFDHLASSDAVLGPSDDGGYYLIGLSRPVPAAFDGIAWSTPAVWRQTIERLAAARCSHRELASWYDIDSSADLSRLRRELAEDASVELSELRRLVLETTSGNSTP